MKQDTKILSKIKKFTHPKVGGYVKWESKNFERVKSYEATLPSKIGISKCGLPKVIFVFSYFHLIIFFPQDFSEF